MNLRSFEKVNLRAASIRSNTSSESLMLFYKILSVFDPSQDKQVSSVGLTLRRGPGDLNNANTPDVRRTRELRSANFVAK